MKIRILLLLLAITAANSALAQDHKSQTISWADSTRDVYIDNELDRGAQVLTSDSPSRLALISTKLASGIVLDVTAHTVSTIPKEAFHLVADRTSATSNSESNAVGKFTRVDGPVYSFVAEGKLVVIRSHPGLTGEMSLEKLWETVPVWRSEMEVYQPNADAVAQIKSNDKDTRLTLAFGTWCPDSKNYVPKIIKALGAAGNDKIQVKLIGIDNQFHEPVASVQPLRITNVPTIIVERGGREIGRIVETPALNTMEEDLAAILAGKQVVHNGRWDRAARLASGTYSYRDRSGKEIGSETFELFGTAEGGYLVHSRIAAGDLTIEVYHRVDAKRHAAFAEVTKLHGDERTRTRFNFDGNTMTARMRGSVSGVISQTLEVPERFLFSSPAVAAQGLGQSFEGDRFPVLNYVAPPDFQTAMGTLVTLSCEAKAEETVRVPAGEFHARHLMRRSDKESSEWWVHSQLGIPVKGQASGIDYVLTKLEAAGK